MSNTSRKLEKHLKQKQIKIFAGIVVFLILFIGLGYMIVPAKNSGSQQVTVEIIGQFVTYGTMGNTTHLKVKLDSGELRNIRLPDRAPVRKDGRVVVYKEEGSIAGKKYAFVRYIDD